MVRRLSKDEWSSHCNALPHALVKSPWRTLEQRISDGVSFSFVLCWMGDGYNIQCVLLSSHSSWYAFHYISTLWTYRDT